MTSFIAESALRSLGGFWRIARGGIRVGEVLIDASAEDSLVWVGLFLVHPDIAELQDLIRLHAAS